MSTTHQETRVKNNRNSLAAFLYETYCQAVGGIAFNGDKLPSWAEFCVDPKKSMQAAAWLKVASSVLQGHEIPGKPSTRVLLVGLNHWRVYATDDGALLGYIRAYNDNHLDLRFDTEGADGTVTRSELLEIAEYLKDLRP